MPVIAWDDIVIIDNRASVSRSVNSSLLIDPGKECIGAGDAHERRCDPSDRCRTVVTGKSTVGGPLCMGL